MGVSNAPTAKGKEAARELRQSAAEEERKIDSKGSDLEKGAARFEERWKSSDGKRAGAKQRDRGVHCESLQVGPAAMNDCRRPRHR